MDSPDFVIRQIDPTGWLKPKIDKLTIRAHGAFAEALGRRTVEAQAHALARDGGGLARVGGRRVTVVTGIATGFEEVCLSIDPLVQDLRPELGEQGLGGRARRIGHRGGGAGNGGEYRGVV